MIKSFGICHWISNLAAMYDLVSSKTLIILGNISLLDDLLTGCRNLSRNFDGSWNLCAAITIWATSWENLFMVHANNKGADLSAHPRSLTSAFVVRCIDNIMHLVSICEISSLYQASVAAQAGLLRTWLQTPKTGFLVTRLLYAQQLLLNKYSLQVIVKAANDTRRKWTMNA